MALSQTRSERSRPSIESLGPVVWNPLITQFNQYYNAIIITLFNQIKTKIRYLILTSVDGFFAVAGQSSAASGDESNARHMLSVSYRISVAGIIVGVIVFIMVLVVYHSLVGSMMNITTNFFSSLNSTQVWCCEFHHARRRIDWSGAIVVWIKHRIKEIELKKLTE